MPTVIRTACEWETNFTITAQQYLQHQLSDSRHHNQHQLRDVSSTTVLAIVVSLTMTPQSEKIHGCRAATCTSAVMHITLAATKANADAQQSFGYPCRSQQSSQRKCRDNISASKNRRPSLLIHLCIRCLASVVLPGSSSGGGCGGSGGSGVGVVCCWL